MSSNELITLIQVIESEDFAFGVQLYKSLDTIDKLLVKQNLKKHTELMLDRVLYNEFLKNKIHGNPNKDANRGPNEQ